MPGPTGLRRSALSCARKLYNPHWGGQNQTSIEFSMHETISVTAVWVRCWMEWATWVYRVRTQVSVYSFVSYNIPPATIFAAFFLQLSVGGAHNEHGGFGKISSRSFHRDRRAVRRFCVLHVVDQASFQTHPRRRVILHAIRLVYHHPGTMHTLNLIITYRKNNNNDSNNVPARANRQRYS